MRRYAYKIEFYPGSTYIRLGERECTIKLKYIEVRTNVQKLTEIIVKWETKEGKLISYKFEPYCTIILEAYNGWINYEKEERGRKCFGFLNLLRRIEKNPKEEKLCALNQ